MKLNEIGWDDVVGVLKRKTPTVIAALCTAKSDGRIAAYPVGERHTVLLMLRVEEPEADSAIHPLLEMNGWHDGVVLEKTKLEQSFFSDDRLVRACYVNALTSNGGCLVYDELVEE